MRYLVTGGAGYIGSFMAKRLINENFEVVIVDSLEEGHRQVIPHEAMFIEGNLLDRDFISDVFSSNTFDGVLHFAAYISMKESMENPGKYFQNNVQAAVNLLDAMGKASCRKFIFSSTAGVYGNPISSPIPEDHPKKPTNPYGESKYLVERMLPWYRKVFGIGSVALRYFNAAGAALDGSMGENHRHETHIIPNVIRSLLRGEEFTLFGSDYNTPDGTCVRDYIHVLDLVEGHVLALKKLEEDEGTVTAYNVGTGKGYSNKQIVEMIEKVSGQKVEVIQKDRRPGDADSLVADVSRITNELNFHAKHSDLETIVSTAWKWHQGQGNNSSN